MKRKVVQHGPSTLIVSLPSRWIKQCGISKGDEINIEENGSQLIVQAEHTKTQLEITKDVSGYVPRLVDRFLARSYQKGYDVITLTYNDVKILEVIRQKVHELMGLEVIEQTPTKCIIKSISDSINIDFDQSLRRIFLILKEMMTDCATAYKKNDVQALETLELKDLEVNRFAYYCLRQLTKEDAIGPEIRHQRFVLYYLIENLEDLGDCYKKMAKKMAKNPKPSKQIQGLLQKVLEQFEMSYNFFYSPSKEGANEAYSLNEQARDLIADAAGSKLNKEDIISLYFIKEATHIIYHIASMRLDTIK